MFWRSTIDVTIEGYNLDYIDAIINKNRDNAWHFTGIYGELDTQKRIESWDLLRMHNGILS